MFLVDFNQIAISNLMVAVNSYAKNEKIDENLLRHMILNSLRMYNKKFKAEYGEMIICCDGRDYWRKDIFPYYKASRKQTREASDIDWGDVFESLNTIRDDLDVHFPYGVMNIPRAEADDIIGVLVLNKAPFEPALILSGDKDFLQLQDCMNVTQYAPVQKKFLKETSPVRYLKEHIIRGDRSDGIPNFLSPDNVFMVEGRKQKSIMKAKVTNWLDHEPEDFCNEEMLRNFKRNEQLIDLSMVPLDVKTAILSDYDRVKDGMGDRGKLFNYFVKNRLRNLMDCIQEF